MVRISTILALVLLPCLVFGQLKSRYVGSVQLNNFTSSGSGNYDGDLQSFVDQYGQQVDLTDMQIGYGIVDGKGDVYNVTVINSATAFEAEVIVNEAESGSGAPTGIGQVYNPTATGIIPVGVVDNDGISRTQKGRIDQHNALVLDSLIATVENGDSITALSYVNDTLFINTESGNVWGVRLGIDSLHNDQVDSLSAIKSRYVDSISAGANIQITGAGTSADPYVIAVTGVPGGTDDQTAGEVWYNDIYLPLNANDVQEAIDSLKSDLAAVSAGASDGVAQSGALDAANEEIDVTVASPGTSFSIDMSGIENMASFSGWDTNASDDFSGNFTDLNFAGTTGFSDNTDDERTDEEIQDVAGGMVTGNTETLITVTYDDPGGKLNYVVQNDLSQYDNSTSGFLSSEVDGSVTNEGQLSVAAGGANDAQIQSNTSGSSAVTISGGSNVTVTENTGTGVITIAASGSGSGAFATASNVTSNSPGTLASDDFVFGSDQLDDAANADKDHRFLYDKSLAYFAAGSADGTQWDAANRGPEGINLGKNNISKAIAGSILGGEANTVDTGFFSLVVQGNLNQATGDYSSILNGLSNEVQNDARHSAILGGNGGHIRSDYCIMGPGINNSIALSSNYATLFGTENSISGPLHTISGGENNSIDDSAFGPSVIGGGVNHTITTGQATIAGGSGNTISEEEGTIGGGTSNTVSGIGAIIPGGHDNQATDAHAMASGVSAEAALRGQVAHSAGAFGTTRGSAQVQQMIVRAEQTGTGTHDLYLDGVSEEMVMPNNSLWTGRWDCSIVAMNSAGDVTAGDQYSRSGYFMAKNVSGDITVTAATSYTLADVSMNQSAALFFADDADNSVRAVVNPDDGGGSTLQTRSVCRIDVTQIKY